MHGDSSIGQQVFQLKRFHQVCVPHHAAVLDAHILKGGNTLVNLLTAVLKRLLGPENCCITLQQTIIQYLRELVVSPNRFRCFGLWGYD